MTNEGSSRPSQAMLRRAARHAAEAGGHAVRVKTTRGAISGSRLEFTVGKEVLSAVVRTSYERLIGFSRKQDGTWRPLAASQICLLAVPSETSDDQIEVYEFESKVLEGIFDDALTEMTRSGKAPAKEIPIYVALDDETTRSLGHSVAGIKKLAKCRLVSVLDLAPPKNNHGGFVARVKREFAELMGVDVSEVEVEFRVVPRR
jgi:hypothetical protein